MKNFNPEELEQFVANCLRSGEQIVSCCGINTPNREIKKFICLTESISFRMYWRGDTQTLNAGDYLHANPKDIYGLPAEKFFRSYKIINT